MMPLKASNRALYGTNELANGQTSTVGAVYEGVNELSGEHIPLLEKEGWMRDQKISRSHLSPRRRGGQAGEMIRPERFRRADHYLCFALSRLRYAPVCGNSVASRYLIDAAATLLQGGNVA
jgi:hypothetical protein